MAGAAPIGHVRRGRVTGGVRSRRGFLRRQHRLDLLRREALELALYTFKYESDVEAVVAYMPPTTDTATGAKGNTMLFFRRRDVKRVLDVPLARTLSPPKGNLRPGQMTTAELRAVRQLTTSRFFAHRFGALQDGSPILVLQPAA